MQSQLVYRTLALALAGLWAATVFAQSGSVLTDAYRQALYEQAVFKLDQRSHLNSWPLALRDVAFLEQNASLDTGYVSRLNALSHAYLQYGTQSKWSVQLDPVLDIAVGYSSEMGGLYNAVGGFQARLSRGEKLSLFTEVIGGVELAPAYINRFVDSLSVVPGMGRNLGSGDQTAYLLPTLALSYAPSQYFQFDLGFGNHRFGSGYRSLMLSDTGFNYPYLRITTDVWHLKYTNLFAAMTHMTDEAMGRHDTQPKYMASHHLSWAISKRITFSVFESIIWQGRDSLTERGFDPNYLNPVIFYRPVEFAMGSADRVLIGADVSVRLGKKAQMYGQVVFDEFLLEFLRERTGWWANKWGVQIGAKAYDLFGLTGLSAQAEYNVARPFIYSHGSVVQNYAHFHQPLAHPLGSNFREGVLMLNYEKNRWYVGSHTVASSYGRDAGPNLGGNLFRSYVDPAFQFGNEIGQGRKHQVLFQRLTVGRVIEKKLNLRLALRYTYRKEEVEGGEMMTEHFVGLHLSTGIRTRYRDF